MSTAISPLIVQRPVPQRHVATLEQQGIDPILARVFAARGITHRDELETDLIQLLPPDNMRGIDTAAALLADTLLARKRFWSSPTMTVMVPLLALWLSEGCVY